MDALWVIVVYRKLVNDASKFLIQLEPSQMYQGLSFYGVF